MMMMRMMMMMMMMMLMITLSAAPSCSGRRRRPATALRSHILKPKIELPIFLCEKWGIHEHNQGWHPLIHCRPRGQQQVTLSAHESR